jgi:Skp family chaperone for outer membrane proteins
MQLHKAIVLLSLAAIVVWGTAAQDEPLKIGIVDVDEALTSTAEGKAARDELARKQREAQAKIQPLLERLEIMEDDFKAKRFLISDEARFQDREQGEGTQGAAAGGPGAPQGPAARQAE